MSTFMIYENGRVAVCPLCSGMLTRPHPMMYKCCDCHAMYNMVDDGLTEREQQYELVAGGK